MIKRIIGSQCKGIPFPTRGSNLKEIENNAEKEASAFIQPLYNKAILEDFKKRHDIYDKETDHSKIKSRQNLYNAGFKQFRKIKSKK